jgi:sec-independent protein translocase protein TatA
MPLGLENPVHLLIVLAVVLLVFGAGRVPAVGRSLGRGMREFKDGITGLNSPESPDSSPPTPRGERDADA